MLVLGSHLGESCSMSLGSLQREEHGPRQGLNPPATKQEGDASRSSGPQREPMTLSIYSGDLGPFTSQPLTLDLRFWQWLGRA